MSDTLFFTPLIQMYSDDVTDPMSSGFVQAIFPDEITASVDFFKVESATMDDGDTKTVALLGSALADSKFLLLKVVGEAHVTTAAKDFNGSTDIVGSVYTYGTALWPGFLLLSTYNVSSITVESDQDSSDIQIFIAKLS